MRGGREGEEEDEVIIKIYRSLQDDAAMGSTADLEFNINKKR